MKQINNLENLSPDLYLRYFYGFEIIKNFQKDKPCKILTVGDTDFQAKCFAKMEEFKKLGVTILFVSHSLETIKSFCTSVMYINHHQIQYNGTTLEASQKYLDDQDNKI